MPLVSTWISRADSFPALLFLSHQTSWKEVTHHPGGIMPKPRAKNARVTSTLGAPSPLGTQYDLAEYDGIPRSLYVLEGNTDRLLIGTTTDFPGLLSSLFRDNGMVQQSYYVSAPSKSAVYALRELRAFCVENSEEHLDLNLFRGIDFKTVADKASQLIPGEVIDRQP